MKLRRVVISSAAALALAVLFWQVPGPTPVTAVRAHLPHALGTQPVEPKRAAVAIAPSQLSVPEVAYTYNVPEPVAEPHPGFQDLRQHPRVRSLEEILFDPERFPPASPVPPGAGLGRSASEPIPTVFGTTFDSFDLGTQEFIPPDPHGAVGTSHVVNVVNSSYAFYSKAGVLEEFGSLFTFFSAAVTRPIDPRVVYDHFEDRFVITAFEVFASPATSRMHVAVSDDGDPNGLWFQTTVDTKVAFGLGPPPVFLPPEDTFGDYPAPGLDDEALYITTNQIGFTSGSIREARIWVVDKGLVGGFYSGGVASVTLLDPPDRPGSPFANFMLSPAHVFGAHPDATLGTYFTSVNRDNDGLGNSEARVFALTSPLTAPAFNLQIVNLGLIDAMTGPVPGSPQLSGATPLDPIGRAVHSNSVWRAGDLYFTVLTQGPPGPDFEQGVAVWIQLDATVVGAASLFDSGFAGAEDVAAGTHTIYPSVAVDAAGNMGLTFTISGPLINPGAAFAYRAPGDAAGTLRPTQVLRPGVDSYEILQFFGKLGINRWGDYSGIDVDPVTDCFWVYNEYVKSLDVWGTFWGENCVQATCGNSNVQPNETCDPPGAPAGQPDECRDNCTHCGDGIVQQGDGETCDDGGNANGDGCDANCNVEICANDVVQTGETCDPPGSTPVGGQGSSTCRADCTYCGDNSINGDGNLIVNGDFEIGDLTGWRIEDAGSGAFGVEVPGSPTSPSGLPTAPNPAGGDHYGVSRQFGGAGTHALLQTFTVPQNATSVTLEYDLFVNNWNSVGGGALPPFGTFIDPAGLTHNTDPGNPNPPPNQHGRVDIINTGVVWNDTSAAAVVRNLYIGADPLSPPENAYTSYSFPITTEVDNGETYDLRFATVTNQANINMGVDNVRIVVLPLEGCDDGNNDTNDGCQSFCEPCPVAVFPNVRVGTGGSFRWNTWADVTYVVGDLDDVSTLSGTQFFRTFTKTVEPQPDPPTGDGDFYIFRFDCPGSTWSSGGIGETGDRDAALP